MSRGCGTAGRRTHPDHAVAIAHGVGSHLNPARNRQQAVARGMHEEPYAKAVLPVPGAPQISDTWPRLMPPWRARWSGGADPRRALSRLSRPVDMGRPGSSSSASSACDAATVGGLSGPGQLPHLGRGRVLGAHGSLGYRSSLCRARGRNDSPLRESRGCSCWQLSWQRHGAPGERFATDTRYHVTFRQPEASVMTNALPGTARLLPVPGDWQQLWLANRLVR